MIGIFDSGVGGLTVAKEIMKELPGYDLVYFGDTARAPYGNKSKETIINYALEDADFLIKKGAKMIVIACNTASAYAFEALKEKYPDMPIFEVITPAVEAAAEATKNKRIGVIGTRATIKSEIYNKKLQESVPIILPLGKGEAGRGIVVFSAACPLFVPFIEEGTAVSRELKMIARKYLSVFKNKNIDTLILGCTHYPIIKNIIQAKAGQRVKLIDSASAAAQKVKKFLESHPEISSDLSKNNGLEFYVSDLTDQSQCIANRVLSQNIKLQQP